MRPPLSIRECPSPNYGDRRGAVPSLIVLHYTAMGSAAAAIARLCDPACEVSAHYVIDRDGDVTRLVADEHRAWHAGAGAWLNVTDVNSHSLGIELDNPGDAPFPEAQMLSLEALLSDLRDHWRIGPEGVIGHSDCAPGRKSDPGTHFDWARLERAGHAQPAVAGVGSSPDMERFLMAARTCGWTAEATPEDILTAVRLRHRRGATGPLGTEDMKVVGL
ncbi:N-acetylmuramoyl-L-alanine amidase [Pontivivens ytuae]|uniref:N-acetylmuramoyl-L-alanine amidase n=1 Tax=Pontivivens ytuae TaxID=2789856 RepID=A0A7S9LTM8_9RHOB|nr:N-acetylmuramoyl-L-alanine amidase [Pontivivens ytuae]QPH55064.1 N-acetylmuramoyl-L-alanine amidase [Pontivivens ytuae]